MANDFLTQDIFNGKQVGRYSFNKKIMAGKCSKLNEKFLEEPVCGYFDSNLDNFSQGCPNLTMIPEKINSSTRTRLRSPIFKRKDFSKRKAKDKIRNSLSFSPLSRSHSFAIMWRCATAGMQNSHHVTRACYLEHGSFTDEHF